MVVSSTSTNMVKVGSHLDVRNVELVRSTVNAAIGTAEAGSDVVLDLHGLAMIDAAGLGMLMAAHLRAERVGARLVLRNCSDDVRRLLAITHLNRVLRVDRSDAAGTPQSSSRSSTRSLLVASSAATL